MMLKRLFFTLIMLIVPTLYVMPAYAVDINPVCKDIPNTAVCVDAKAGQTSNPLFGSDGILTKAVSILGYIVGVAAVIVLMVAGIRFAIKGSNPQEALKERNTIIYAVVGIIVAVLAQAIVQLILVRL